MSDARLEVTDALGRRIVPIAKSQFEIGRRETNDLRLAGSEVSRDHAAIAVENNKFVLRDRNSRYGTYVNGDQVTERTLAHGDRIRLGRTGGAEMVFLLADSQPPVDRATTTAVGDLRQIAALLEGLRAVMRPSARLEVRLNASALAEAGWELLPGGERVRDWLAWAGFDPRPPRLLDAAALRALPTTWAKRLAFSRRPEAVALEGILRCLSRHKWRVNHHKIPFQKSNIKAC